MLRRKNPPPYCEVCNVHCGTIHALGIHNTGHKHRKKLKKLQARAVAGVISLGTREHMEVKRRRLHDNGAPKREVRFCESCNLLLYSQIDYEHHIDGKSHRTKVQNLVLEEKKRRVIESGADPCEVKICYACNNVVNNWIVYKCISLAISTRPK